MSLINDALKKAQKQRTGETAPLPAVGGESAVRIARRGKPAGFNVLLVRLGIGAAVVVAVVVGTLIFVRREPATPVAPQTPAVTPTAVAVAPTVQAPAPKPVEVVSAPVTPPPAIIAPVTTASAPVAPTHVQIEPVRPKIETPAPVVVAPVTAPVISVTAPETPRATPAGRLEPRAITFIESIRVAGIRASGSDRKVLMNDRVYRLNDLVEPELGLTLVGIAANALTFQDEKGAKYTRNF